ncbi:PREDICTED: E3 ubiquitin-protein ligase ATL23 [Tarenaya hassleriana]|uniref:E3 ubiquitin-protein ligase ATL23 n=1 Tax=Tarenaya hassleriana TaxID=28532 RepID=UPI00053C805C|nr:PREDICTED: E3 ubiquitin-protein ligase ATL23 [Tarenaya hassleriana]
MRLSAHHAHFLSVFAPSPPPSSAVSPASTAGGGKMIASLFMALLLPCVAMSVVFVIYLCLLWYSTRRRQSYAPSYFPEPVKPVTGKGLSVSELEKIPKLTGKELAMVGRSTECAVCLDDIESGQPARLVPGCNHGFHQYCADTWLTDHTVCPVCRAELAPKLFECDGDQSPC